MVKIEAGRKGRLQVIKSMKRKLARARHGNVQFPHLVRWLCLHWGYSKKGALAFIREMQEFNIIIVRERKREGERESAGERVYEAALKTMRKRTPKNGN